MPSVYLAVALFCFRKYSTCRSTEHISCQSMTMHRVASFVMPSQRSQALPQCPTRSPSSLLRTVRQRGYCRRGGVDASLCCPARVRQGCPFRQIRPVGEVLTIVAAVVIIWWCGPVSRCMDFPVKENTKVGCAPLLAKNPNHPPPMVTILYDASCRVCSLWST